MLSISLGNFSPILITIGKVIDPLYNLYHQNLYCIQEVNSDNRSIIGRFILEKEDKNEDSIPEWIDL